MSPRPLLSTCAAALVTGALCLAALPASAREQGGAAGDSAAATTAGVYVVTMSAPGAAAHPRTRPRDGERFDRTRPSVADYTARLLAAQERALGAVGDPAVLYHYTTALNGFAASLSADQVVRLRRTPGVLRVERSAKRRVDATPTAPLPSRVGSSSRDLLELDGPGGAWAAHGGTARAGAGVVVGVVDTGLWPDNPSFTGLPQRTPGTAATLPGFHGDCSPAEDWSVQDCTDKVVSARWFVRGFGEENVASAEYLSPRDGTGHGSHVASTAAGVDEVRVVVEGQRFGTTSGMAPAARLAVYKACWSAPDPDDDGCTTADTVAAVDRAVADGVDVLNYSISGSGRDDDAVARAFLGAADAGVFVTTSAGNGAQPGSVQHSAPWVTTVGASTHQVFQGAVRLAGGRELVGAMVSDQAVPDSRLALGADLAAPGASRAAARVCRTGSLDAAKAEGAIVVCERGAGPRAEKSAAVASAGGAAMVLTNTRPASTHADVHAVPTVHLDLAAARTLTTYLRGAGDRARAALDPAGRTDAPVPAAAGFTARGPTASGDAVKPDLTAPGVGILGAVAPPADGGRSWDVASGTSTSAPHVAGLAAFLASVRPSWSPARLKSAMMTTAYDLRGDPDPFVQGAGHVDPSRFFGPGLVFDTDAAEWDRVAAGEREAADVNAPSLAIGDLVGPRTVTRTVTNVSQRTESFAVKVRGLDGVDVQAFPATVLLAPGESADVRLRVSARPTATVDRDVTGWLVWKGDRHRVRIPVAVRPTAVAAPDAVDAPVAAGEVVVRGRSGNGRTVRLHSTGLVAAETSPVSLAPGDFDRGDPRADADTAARAVTVPPGTAVVRVRGDDDTGAALPVDLYVYRDDELVETSSARGDGVTLTNPEPGDYTVYAHARTTGSAATVGELATWVVPPPRGPRGVPVDGRGRLHPRAVPLLRDLA